jgi:hypothetical protein
MSIVESKTSSSNHSGAKLGKLLGAALMSSAAFVAMPRPAQGGFVSFYATGDQSWFNTSNWVNITLSTTGTLPESGAFTVGALDLNANNASMPANGILFDPANQIGNASYVAKVEIANNSGSFYVAAANTAGNSLNSAPNKLTVNSGTLEVYSMTVGRDYSAQLTQNGGLLKIDHGLRVGGANSTGDFATTVNGSGTYEYHGGTLLISSQSSGIGTTPAIGLQIGSQNNEGGLSNTSVTTPEVGKFVVYNDQAAGAILVNGGVSFATNTNNAGTTGIVEFHYDKNLSGIANVRPIQANFGADSVSQLVLNNGQVTTVNFEDNPVTYQLTSELNLVIDSAVTMIGGRPQNLGLFAENTISGAATFPKIFYATDGVTGYTQGATISSVLSGVTYSWTISYSGLITFTNTATSAYDSVTGISATSGTDVVLIGVAVPEPSSVALLGGVGSLILARRRKRSAGIA